MMALPSGPFEVIVIDPPWNYYGSTTKWAAAGKHYPLMTDEELAGMRVSSILAKRSIVFMWATSSSIARAVDLMRGWGLHYRGVAFVWVKTRGDGAPIGAQGVRPSVTKPLTEFVLTASTKPKGRPLPLASEAIRQTIFAQRARHSEKPDAIQQAIEVMYPTARKAELFARRHRAGWSCWGNELDLRGEQAP